MNGAAMTAASSSVRNRRGVSKRVGASLKMRTPMAAIRPSDALVRKSVRINGSGHWVGNWTIRCAGSADSSTSAQRRGGVRSSAAVRMAFGGHTVPVPSETGGRGGARGRRQ